jgi:TRAP-type C4-dicarboxylate transport system permease small subunit
MVSRITAFCSFFAGVALLAMAFLGFADIVGINVFRTPVPGVVEITSSLMVASIFLGLPITEARGQNIRVEVLLDFLPRAVRLALDVIARLSMAAMFSLVAWFGSQSLIKSIQTNEYAQGLIEVPYWPARLALFIGATLVAVQALAASWRAIKRGRGEQDEGVTWKV